MHRNFFNNKKWNKFLFELALNCVKIHNPNIYPHTKIFIQSFSYNNKYIKKKNFDVPKSKYEKFIISNSLKNFKNHQEPTQLCLKWKKIQFSNNTAFNSLYLSISHIIFLPVVKNFKKIEHYINIKIRDLRKNLHKTSGINSKLIFNYFSIKQIEYNINQFILLFLNKLLKNI
jgi:hypothetical protein